MRKDRFIFLAAFVVVALFMGTVSPMKEKTPEKETPRFIPGQFYKELIKKGSKISQRIGWKFEKSILTKLSNENIKIEENKDYKLSQNGKNILIPKNTITNLMEIIRDESSKKELKEDKVYFFTKSKPIMNCSKIIKGTGEVIWTSEEKSSEDNRFVSWVKEHKVATLATIGAVVFVIGLKKYLKK